MSIKVFFNAFGLTGVAKTGYESKEGKIKRAYSSADFSTSETTTVKDNDLTTVCLDHEDIQYIDPKNGTDPMSKYLRKNREDLLDKVTVITQKASRISEMYLANIPFDSCVESLTQGRGFAVNLIR